VTKVVLSVMDRIAIAAVAAAVVVVVVVIVIVWKVVVKVTELN
jgi:hypothetical protein